MNAKIENSPMDGHELEMKRKTAFDGLRKAVIILEVWNSKPARNQRQAFGPFDGKNVNGWIN